MSGAAEEEVTKERFKGLYFHHSRPNSGWTREYWDQFFEKEEGKKYFYEKPETPESVRMFIVTDGETRRMIFLTEEAEERFFDFPGKE
jgi:hypothetical protein